MNATADTTTSEPRVQIAKDLLAKLRRKKALAQLITNMELVSTGLVSLAYADAAKCPKRGNGCVIPRNQVIRSIRNLDNVLVPTVTMPIRKHKNYNNIVGECSPIFLLLIL